MKQNFSPENQNEFWCTDITYIRTMGGFVYLTCIMELFLRKIINMDHARRLIFEYIDTFYNTTRIHSACNYFSPEEFERNYEQRVS